MLSRLSSLAAGLVVVVSGCGGTTFVDNASGHATSSPTLRTVFLIVMENHDWRSIAGNSSAPYINRTLLPAAAHATRYFNPPAVHPSLPNYLWLEAGTNFGIADDGSPAQHPLATRAHLVALLTRARISSRAYEEGIAGATCPLASIGEYAPKHDPFVYFRDVNGGLNPRSKACISHVRPFSRLKPDLARGGTARYNFVTPSLCDDMHDACPPLDNQVLQGDRWLARQVPMILRSRAYRSGGVLFITWDEGEGDDGPIGMIVLSPDARRGYTSRLHYTHSSTLRTIEEIFGVKPFLGDARRARDLRALFTRFP